MIRAVLALALFLCLVACGPAGSASSGGGSKPDDEASATPAGTPPQTQGERWPPDGSTGPMPTGEVTATLEPGFDRPGYDVGQIEGLETPEQCRQACLDDNRCHAFTWVRAGVQGDQARCWIKTDVPPQREDACCVSGVVEGRPFDPH